MKEILDAECKGYGVNGHGQGGKVSVLIDCGALLAGMSNREVAEAALFLRDRFLAAIYFNDENQVLVLDKDGKETPLSKSPLQPSHPCFTYLDDRHTRGTDLRFARLQDHEGLFGAGKYANAVPGFGTNRGTFCRW